MLYNVEATSCSIRRKQIMSGMTILSENLSGENKPVIETIRKQTIVCCGIYILKIFGQ